MKNKNDFSTELSRMKDLMKFGINESKKPAYSGIEYEKVAADGKMYGIVREGAKFYIKVNPSKKGQIVENYEYIGGFRNRKDNQYSSYAEAQKQFDLKMMSINEANSASKKIVIESWNPDKQEELTVEATDKMRKEISRQRQIMMNASRISEKKEQDCKAISCDGSACAEPFCDNIKKSEKHETGDPKKANSDYKNASLKDTDIKEGTEPLAWHREGDTKNDEYMDKSNGTEIGDSSPFDKNVDAAKDSKAKNGVVVEGESMHDSDNQNTPSVGTSEVGDDEPFDEKPKKVNEDIEPVDADADVEDGDDEFDVEDDSELGDDELGDDESINDEPLDDFDDDIDTDEDDDIADDVDPEIADLQAQISDISSKLDALLSANGVDEPTVDSEDYEDDDLFGDDEDDDEFGGDELDDEEPIEDETVYESVGVRRMRALNEAKMRRMKRLRERNELHDFGKHPAYRKKVMTLPTKDHQEKEGYYDMNDESVYNDSPYGEKIGDGAPFEVDVDKIENAITESIMRYFKKGKKQSR